MVTICHPDRVREITTTQSCFPLSNMIPAFLFLFISFEDLGEWRENLSRWAALFTTQNCKSVRCDVEFLSSQLFLKTDPQKSPLLSAWQGWGPSWASPFSPFSSSQTPLHLPESLMCNITKCKCKYFNMTKIDFCNWHGILMIGNNILIF